MLPLILEVFVWKKADKHKIEIYDNNERSWIWVQWTGSLAISLEFNIKSKDICNLCSEIATDWLLCPGP